MVSLSIQEDVSVYKMNYFSWNSHIYCVNVFVLQYIVALLECCTNHTIQQFHNHNCTEIKMQAMLLCSILNVTLK